MTYLYCIIIILAKSGMRRTSCIAANALSSSILVMILVCSVLPRHSVSSFRHHLCASYFYLPSSSLRQPRRRIYASPTSGVNGTGSGNTCPDSQFAERKELRWSEYLSLSKEVKSVIASFTTSSTIIAKMIADRNFRQSRFLPDDQMVSGAISTREADGVVYVSSNYLAKTKRSAENEYVTSTSSGDDTSYKRKRFYSSTISAIADSNCFTSTAERSVYNPSQHKFTTRDISFRSIQQRRSASSSDNRIGNNERSKWSFFQTPNIELTPEEKKLFALLKKVVKETKLKTTLRVAGGWVRDKLLATKEFRQRYEGTISEGGDFYNLSPTSSSLSQASKGRKGTGVIGGGASTAKSLADDALNGSSGSQHQQPVDIDIALDNMLGREFADHLNEWLSTHGRKTVSVGMVLKNPEKSKHLETATMKVNQFWIDFVNLRAEEYTDESSRIPDLMRIGTPEEDAFRRDLTINSLFYNINSEVIEDLTGCGVKDLFDGVIATPLPPLTTLLDDPLRVLRSVRFAARLRFSMDERLREAARDPRVHEALAMKVSRERVGGEVDLMLRSYDPVGAMRLLINLHLIHSVFPLSNGGTTIAEYEDVFSRGLVLLSTTHDHLCDCKKDPPVWCQPKRTQKYVPRTIIQEANIHTAAELMLIDDEESRRLLWYASFLKPLRDLYQQSKAKHQQSEDAPIVLTRRQGKKAHQSVVMKVMIDDLKRSVRDAEEVEKIQKGAEDFSKLIIEGGAISASTVLLNGIKVHYRDRSDESAATENKYHGTTTDSILCTMTGDTGEEKIIDPVSEQDSRWLHAMEFRVLCAKLLCKVNNRWRAALILSLSEQLALVDQFETNYSIEGDVVDQINEDLRQRIIDQYNAFAAALIQLGLIGVWNQKPLIDGDQLKSNDILPNLSHGPIFREVIEEQMDWITTHPGGSKDALIKHLQNVFLAFAPK